MRVASAVPDSASSYSDVWELTGLSAPIVCEGGWLWLMVELGVETLHIWVTCLTSSTSRARLRLVVRLKLGLS